jgi:hypothetical protein
MIAVVGRFAIRRYQESPLYLGPPDEAVPTAGPPRPALIEAPKA